MNNKDRLRIFENIIGRVGIDGDVLGEYGKAMSTLNGLQTMAEMTPPTMGNIIPTNGQNGGNIPQTPPNQPQVPPMGQNGLNIH